MGALNILPGKLPNLQKVNKEIPFSYYMPYEMILMVTGFYEKQAHFHSLQTVPCCFVFRHFEFTIFWEMVSTTSQMILPEDDL